METLVLRFSPLPAQTAGQDQRTYRQLAYRASVFTTLVFQSLGMIYNFNTGKMSRATFESFKQSALWLRAGDYLYFMGEDGRPADKFEVWVYLVEMDCLELRLLDSDSYRVLRMYPNDTD